MLWEQYAFWMLELLSLYYITESADVEVACYNTKSLAHYIRVLTLTKNILWGQYSTQFSVSCTY